MFQHDCLDCVYLETIKDQAGRPHDLYVCAKSELAKSLGPTFIVRFGDEGSAYRSTPWKMLEHAHRDDIPDMFLQAHSAVAKRILTEYGDGLRGLMETHLRSLCTPQMLAELGSQATRYLRHPREMSHDTRWNMVLDALHFQVHYIGDGTAEMNLAAGAE